ncbi:MAG: hypothetical protein GX627_00355 [Parcubacteria group bacterium]|nr:hypothetical protein [Parcubacteria group bacterium]
MNEMRFSHQQNKSFDTRPTQEEKPQTSQCKNNSMSALLKIFFLILLVGALISGGFYFWQNSNKIDFDPMASEYYAVFLTNGQVYFGQPVSKSRSEFVLKDVYYLQVSDSATTAQEQLTEPRFSLVKLGQELHGPTDKLYVNVANLIFYEQLKNDSKVVESIKNTKN